MNQKQVESKIRNLMNEILSAIKDEDLKTLIKTKTFLTGGCFKALFHNEIPNDYDFYFIDKSAKDEFEKIIKKGFSKKDGFTNTKILYMDFKAKTEFAISFLLNKNTKIQFITKYFGLPEKVTNNFDFEHTKNYYLPAMDIFSLDTLILENKKLIFNKTASHPINALKRLQKFIQQKWTIEDKELMKIAESISILNLQDPKVYKEQSSGMYLEKESRMRGYNSRKNIG